MLAWQDIDDAQLLSIAKNGEAEAFGALYERYADPIFRFLYARLDNRLDAEDLTEEVFLRFWRSLPRYYDKEFPVAAFLFRVAQNALIDHHRRSGRIAQNVSIEDGQFQDLGPGTAEKASQNIKHQELRDMLEELREDYRNVLVLRFLNDLSIEETAQVMDRSAGAIRVLQHRALAAIRKLMDKKD